MKGGTEALQKKLCGPDLWGQLAKLVNSGEQKLETNFYFIFRALWLYIAVGFIPTDSYMHGN